MWTLPRFLRPGDHPTRVRLGVAVGAGVLLGLLLIPRTQDSSATETPELSLYGRVLPRDAGASDLALQWVRERVAGWFHLQLPDGSSRDVSYGSLGVEIDRTRLRKLVERARQPYPARSAPAAPIPLVVPLRLNGERAVATLLALKDELDQSARDARLDLDHQTIIGERAGRLLDLDRSLQAIESAISSGAESAPVAFSYRQPERVAAELTDIRHSALLGFFETPYDAAARAEDRTFNLRLAASRLDGYVLMPGQEFDFNLVVGPRDEANGYRVAKVIAEGELVDGIGGGTCQISGTLHAAALFAGLEIVERHPHTRPSAYIKLGFDAAVVYPTINLRLKNPYDFPVVLRETVEQGRVRAEIRGARRPHTVTVLRKIDAARAFDEVERADASLPGGMRVLTQRGVPGFDVRRYRILRDGPDSVRQVVVDRYPPTAQMVRVGTGKRADGSGRPPSTAQAEYLADELLVLSQPAELDAPLLEQRTPGRFGTKGWTREIGAPVWDPGG
jgi:vancomycin resistance protein YoaR